MADMHHEQVSLMGEELASAAAKVMIGWIREPVCEGFDLEQARFEILQYFLRLSNRAIHHIEAEFSAPQPSMIGQQADLFGGGLHHG